MFYFLQAAITEIPETLWCQTLISSQYCRLGSQIKMLADAVSDEGLLPGLQTTVFSLSLLGRRGERLICKVTNPMYESFTLMT